MRISLRLKILLVTAGSAVALVAVLLVAVRHAYTAAAEERMATAMGRMESVLNAGIDHERKIIDGHARSIAREVRFATLTANADRAEGADRAALLGELPALVRDQNAAREIEADRMCWYLFDAAEDDAVRCAYRVTRDKVAGRFGSLGVEGTDGARVPEDVYVEVYFRAFDTAAEARPELFDAPEEFAPPRLLLATEQEVHVVSRPWRIYEPGTGVDGLVGYLTLSRRLERTEAVAALGRAVGDPVYFGLLDRTVAESLAGDAAPEATRALFTDAVRQAVRLGQLDATIAGTRRRFASVPIPVTGAAEQFWGVIAFDLDREMKPLAEAEALVWRAAAAVLVGIVVVSLLLSGGIARPIRRLVAATDQIAAGNLDVTVDATSRDEIGQLAEHFNHMAEGLRERERMRGLLDKVVSQEVAGELMQMERDGTLALGGEVREVSVLFCDLRNFTATTENMTPQDVIEMLNEYLTAVVAPVDAERGVVDKFVGDEVMAVFGAPLGQADSAARALRAATGMQAAMDTLNVTREARGQQPLACGIGVNTGPAVAGLTGSRDRLSYTVLGATVNLAARLCSAAKPGQILLAEGTRADAGGTPVTALQPIEVKGFSKPVAIYAVGTDVKDTRRLERAPVDGDGTA